MSASKILFSVLAITLALWTAYQWQVRSKEASLLFHAGPAQQGFGVIFFRLYKEDKYEFCDGDFMDAGCYTGKYSLSGDTITLADLREHRGIPSNRFLIRRYREMDSTYWQWKYPDALGRFSWKDLKQDDSLQGAEGDILLLNKSGETVLYNDHCFLLRFDKLRNNR